MKFYIRIFHLLRHLFLGLCKFLCKLAVRIEKGQKAFQAVHGFDADASGGHPQPISEGLHKFVGLLVAGNSCAAKVSKSWTLRP